MTTKRTAVQWIQRTKLHLRVISNAIEVQGGITSFSYLILKTFYREGRASVIKKILSLHQIAINSPQLKRHPLFQFLRKIIRLILILSQYIERLGGLRSAIQHLLYLLRKEGIRSLAEKWQRLKKHRDTYCNRNNYAQWISNYDRLLETTKADIQNKIAAFVCPPRISIVMPTYNSSILFLKQALDSVINQLYPHWELCIADDASSDLEVIQLLQSYEKKDNRIRVIYRDKNGHISKASNDALALATHEFIALMDHDDLLPLDALYYVAEAILKHPHAGLIYSDEDKIDIEGNRHTPHFKPDWNPTLFLSNNYICHLAVYRTDLIRKVGGFRPGLEGAQDYDLTLRCIQHLDPTQIVHIPKVLYHWRAHSGSTALALDQKPYFAESGRVALQDYLKNCGISGTVEHTGIAYRLHYTLPTPPPLVSIIVLTRDKYSLLHQCIESILQLTTYENYEILIVDNDSTDIQTLDYLKKLENHANIRIYRDPQPFNYSALTNNAVKYAKGSFLCFLNNDIQVISPDWLNEMCSLALQPSIGAVGAALFYPNETLQHGGIIVGGGGIASHAHRKFPRKDPGYMSRKASRSNFSAVTAACMVVKTDVFQKMGGLNEQDLKIAFNDVDFCLRLIEAGYRNVWTPYAELYHHESASRGLDTTPEKKARFLKEMDYMQKRWAHLLSTDLAYNPNLTLEYEDWSLAWPPRALHFFDETCESS